MEVVFEEDHRLVDKTMCCHEVVLTCEFMLIGKVCLRKSSNRLNWACDEVSTVDKPKLFGSILESKALMRRRNLGNLRTHK